MNELVINNIKTTFSENETLLMVAERVGISIPTLCYHKDVSTPSRCMICLVKDVKKNQYIPSCSAKAYPGMIIDAESNEVWDARKAALEFLMKEHVGDCLGPCTAGCPGKMDIPGMIEEIKKGDWFAAFQIIKKRIPFPAIIGRICPAPCEKVCRRGKVDNPVSIKLMEKLIGDMGLADTSTSKKLLEQTMKSNNSSIAMNANNQAKKVAIIGSGLTGLSTAYFLAINGYAPVIFEKKAIAGGVLRHYEDTVLPIEVVNKEIDGLKELGVEIILNKPVVHSREIDTLVSEYSAVVVAVGIIDPSTAEQLGLTYSEYGLKVDHNTFETNIKGVFAGGNSIKKIKNRVRVLSHAQGISLAVHQFLAGIPITGIPFEFNSFIGKLKKGELKEFLKPVKIFTSLENQKGEQASSFSTLFDEAQTCLECDCIKKEECKLRSLCSDYMVNQKMYKSKERPEFIRRIDHLLVVFEPGKCIKCGNCVAVTKAYHEEHGLTFIGRGYGMVVDVPFDKQLSEGVKKTALECIRVCPTGALGARNA